MTLLKRKKGSIQDVIYIMVVLLVVSITILIVYKVSDSIKTQLDASDKINDKAKGEFGQLNSMYSGVLDSSFMFLMVGLAIAAIALASMVRIHPIFFIFFLFIFVVIIVLCGVFSNLYQAIASADGFETLADDLVMTSYVMQFLPFIVGILGFIIAIIMYRNWSMQQ